MVKSKSFQPGDRVAYAAGFLKSTGQITGHAPFLRGTVRKVEPFSGYTLVTVAWDNYAVKSEYHHDGLARIIAPNLTLISRIAIDAALAN